MTPTLPPLIVDLDGTITYSDTLAESIVLLARKSPWTLLRLPFWLLRGRAAAKEEIAARVDLTGHPLPYREDVVHYLQAQKASGRRLVLATAAHHTIATVVARDTDLFETVLATRDGSNLKSHEKLRAIQQLGPAFVYAGDSAADLPIWRSAAGAVLVGVSAGVKNALPKDLPVEASFDDTRPALATWFKALRIHQWLKNLLIFVPLLTGFAFLDATRIFSSALAFLAFSLAASATYVLNDFWDLANDRHHPRKRFRPFASGELSIAQGMVAALLLMAGALLTAWCVSGAFLGVLLVYVAATTSYSLVLKRFVLIDVIALSLLYTLRIIAGAVAIAAVLSPWLLAFSVFVFLSLALLKRCAELVSLLAEGRQATTGRDYRMSDLQTLWPLGISSALCAAVVFGLFISAPATQARYATPELLWLVTIGLLYWLSRLWIKTSRGEMHDDPIVFTLRDRGSQITLLAMVLVTLLAHYLTVPLPQ